MTKLHHETTLWHLARGLLLHRSLKEVCAGLNVNRKTLHDWRVARGLPRRGKKISQYEN
jgi:hypothetical protein